MMASPILSEMPFMYQNREACESGCGLGLILLGQITSRQVKGGPSRCVLARKDSHATIRNRHGRA